MANKSILDVRFIQSLLSTRDLKEFSRLKRAEFILHYEENEIS